MVPLRWGEGRALNSGIAERRFILNRVVIRFVLHNCAWRQVENCANSVPYLFADFYIVLEAIPHRDNILALSHANSTATDFGPIPALDFSFPGGIPIKVCFGFTPTALVKEIADDAAYQVLPYTIRDALSKTYDPFATRPVQGVFPYGSPDASMEQEIVGGGNERRGRRKMCVERPKRLDGGEGGDFFDSLFVIGDLVPWCPLLAEPKYPSVSEGVHSCRRWVQARAFGLCRLRITVCQGG